MKFFLSMMAILVVFSARASETALESRFHFLTTKCQVELTNGPETTPQSPPLNVDDPATPGCNKWEINVVVDGDNANSQRKLELPLLDVNYGIGDNIQLKYELPYLSNRLGDANTAAIGESKAGIKYMFFEDEKDRFQVAVYPQLTFVKANSDAVEKSLATQGSILTLPLLTSFKLGETSRGEINLTGNVGYNFSTKLDQADFVSASVGIGAPLLDKLSIMSAVSTQQATKALDEDLRLQLVKGELGLVGSINRHFLLFGAFGHSIYSSDTLDHTYGLIGFRLIVNGIQTESKQVASRQEVYSGMSL